MSGEDGAEIVLCSHFLAPEHQAKCGWSGRADKYKAHLAEFHAGKEYKPPSVGLPKPKPKPKATKKKKEE